MTTIGKRCPHSDTDSDEYRADEPIVLPSLELDTEAGVLTVDKVLWQLSAQHGPAETVLLNFSGPCDLTRLLDYIYRAVCVCVCVCVCVLP